MKIKKKSFYLFELLSVLNFNRKLVISKIVTARSSKVGKLIEGENEKKIFFYLSSLQFLS